MTRQNPIKTRPGQRSGEFLVSLPPGWELRLRRILKEMVPDAVPDPHAPGLTPAQREARLLLRQRRTREAVCQFISDLLAADIVGKEVALSTRNHYGRRSGSLREHVAAILREASESSTEREGKSNAKLGRTLR
jgi:hypothetical protein